MQASTATGIVTAERVMPLQSFLHAPGIDAVNTGG